MTPARIARIQVAGVQDADEARMLVACGVEWIGIPLRLPVNREDVPDDQAAGIVRACSGTGVEFVLITYLERAAGIATLALRLGVHHVQVHGRIEVGELAALRTALPGAVLVKSLVIRPGQGVGEVLGEAAGLAPHLDAFITDTYNPATGASGATGLAHDWAISRQVVQAAGKPVILAGGLNPANVEEAIRAVRPAGVDTHTGVEGPDGRKDAGKVRAFVAAARAAFAAQGTGGVSA